MNGYGIKCEHLFYTFLKKHYCPNCGNKLLRKRISSVINSESPEAKDYDFEVVDITVKDDIKFTHIEFYLTDIYKKNNKEKT